MSLAKKIRRLILKLSWKLPVSRGALLNHRYELKLLIDAVKEIEAMNRTDISALRMKFELMTEDSKYEKKFKKDEDVTYQ